jgi:hypothetical protein
MNSIRTTRSALLVVIVVASSVFVGGGTATSASPTPVGLGTATDFAIRAGDQVTNVPTSVITGAVGLSPGTAYPGLTCAEVNAGAGPIYSVDGSGPPCPAGANPGLLTTVENDARTAFNHTSALAGATPTVTDLALLSPLVAGLYSFGHDPTSNINGTLTLDAQGNPNAVWIFQASSDLVTATGSTVQFVNAPAGINLACNVFWTVQSSATIGSGSTFVGTILASASITVGANATVEGRLLAANAAGAGGQVTLISDTITRPTGCAALPPGTGGELPPGELPPAPPTPVESPPGFTG